jgi:G:T/U-mismatch repair DNA glycosylase
MSVYRISPPVVAGPPTGWKSFIPTATFIGETNVESAPLKYEIWEPDMMAVFVSPAILELSERLPHLHPRDRFWELLEMAGITPKRVITPQERKALADGHAEGSLSDPVRLMFIEKKTSQLLHLGIGISELNRRAAVASDKDPSAIPDASDIGQFLAKVEELRPKILAFVTAPEMFVHAFRGPYPGLTGTPGLQQFPMSGSEVWLLGSTTAQLRGTLLTAQEDLFFALGERISALRGEAAT